MWTVNDWPAGRVVGPQSSVWLPTAPVILQSLFGQVWLSIDQPATVPDGNGSDRLVPLASPAPELVTVMVYPSGSPAFTEPASAVLVIVTAAVLHTIVALLWPEPTLVVVKLAVF